MALLSYLFALASVVVSVVSQSVSYTDEGIPFNGLIEPTHNVTYGFVFPPTTETSESTEFIGEVIVPVVNKWVGLALGGQMVGDLLLVAWPNDDEIMFSPRWATDYIQPVAYAGPTITTLSSSVNSTHWKAIFRCQNCTTWSGGDFDTNGTPVFAWVISLTAVFDPTDVNTDFNEHDDFGFWGELTDEAHSDDYDTFISGASSSSAPAAPSSTAPVQSTSSASATSTGSAPAATQTIYGQCGGTGFSGPTACASGSTCVEQSSYYSQCLPS